MQGDVRSDGGGRFRMRVADPHAHLRLPGRRSRVFLGWFAWIALGLAAGVVLLLLAAPLLIDWAAFKPRLIATARAITGHEVEIDRLELHFRPLPTAVLHQVTLAGPGGGGEGWRIRVPEAQARLRLLPLLNGDLIIDQLHLRQPTLHVFAGGEGSPGFAGGEGSLSAPPAGAAAAPRTEPLFDLVGLNRIALEDGRLVYEDRTSDERLSGEGVSAVGALKMRGTSLAALLDSLEADLQVGLAALEGSSLPFARFADLTGTIALPPGGHRASIGLGGRAVARGGDETLPLSLHGDVGRPEALLASGTSFPLELVLRLGQTRARVAGAIRDPLAEARPELDVRIRGDSPRALALLLDHELPDLGPFELEASFEVADQQRIVVHRLESHVAGLRAVASGRIRDADTADPKPGFQIHLRGETLAGLRPLLGPWVPDLGPLKAEAEVQAAGPKLTIDTLDLELAGSDLEGRLDVVVGGARPRVTGSLTSNVIDLPALLAPAPDAAATPEAGLPLALLGATDADLAIEVAELRVGQDLEFQKTALKFGLDAGRLTLDPVESEIAGGGLKGTLAFDASRRPATLETTVDAEAIRIGQLLNDLELVDLGRAEAIATLQLRARGASLEQITRSLEGSAFVSVRSGQLRRGEVPALADGLGEILGPFFQEADTIEIDCSLHAVQIRDGVLTSEGQLVAAGPFGLAGSGRIDLGQGQLDLYFETAARRQAMADLAVPFRVSGPLTAPTARPASADDVFPAAGRDGMLADPARAAAALAARGGPQACEDVMAATRNEAAARPANDTVGRMLEDFEKRTESLLGN